MERRPGKYFGAGTALRQISLATAGTLTLKLSGKSPRSVYFPAQIAPPNAVFGIKNLKKNLGGDPLPHPPSLGPRSRKPFLQIKIYHYTSSTNRSATQQLMVVPRHRLTIVGRRAFAVHGPMVWNSLPDDIRAQQDYESFRQGLKTWLFSRY